MKYRWSIASQQPALAGQLAEALHLPPLLAQCLLNRGLEEPSRIRGFLQPRLKQLADPFLLPDMQAAVERLFRARQANEPLVIFGDYDVDGVTSAALLLEVLRALGWKADCYLPNRIDEGYGLSRDGVENCLKKFPATLLLAVDCGSAAVDSIAWLKQQGVDVVVLDHHKVCSPPPEVVALVNPQLGLLSRSVALHALPAPHAPHAPRLTEFCSAGLAFKFAHALLKRGRATGLPGAAEFDLRPLLDLVALGTIADLVPLTGENRILVSAGLDRLSQTQRPGLVALKTVAQCPAACGVYEVGFQLAPRLNAAGRLEAAEESLRLLLTRDRAEAMSLARKLDAQNRERQKIERRIAEEAVSSIRARFKPESDFVIVEGHELWHIGVVGIVASRVLQQFYRPTIILGGEGAAWRGSGRSIAGFDLASALSQCTDLLVRHGGHAMAAGLTVQAANLDALRARLNDLARQTFRAEDLQAPLRLDAEVGLEEITLDCLSQLDGLKPTGNGNPPVHFFSRNLAHHRPLQRLGAEKQHIKMWVTDGASTVEAVWWGAANELLPEGRFDLAFTPQINDFNNRRIVQLKVLDWRPANG